MALARQPATESSQGSPAWLFGTVETNLPTQIRSRGRKNVVVDRGDTPERIDTSSHQEDKGLAQPLPPRRAI